MKKVQEKKIVYPAEIIFKAIFRQKDYTDISIKNILAESGINGRIEYKHSKEKNFISYTITGVFSSEKTLTGVCNKISTLDGYMTLF